MVLHQHLFCLNSYYLPSTDNKQPLQKGHQVVSMVSKTIPNEGWSQSWKVNIYLCIWLLLLLHGFSRVQLCDPIDGSPPGSPIPGILQARTVEWVAISFSSACIWLLYHKLQ